MIKKAKQILAGIDAKLVSQGKIPQITYIFRAKNFFGMTDKQEVVLQNRRPKNFRRSTSKRRLATMKPDFLSDYSETFGVWATIFPGLYTV